MTDELKALSKRDIATLDKLRRRALALADGEDRPLWKKDRQTEAEALARALALSSRHPDQPQAVGVWDVLGDLERHAESATKLGEAHLHGSQSRARCLGKGAAYAHAAELLRQALSTLSLEVVGDFGPLQRDAPLAPGGDVEASSQSGEG